MASLDIDDSRLPASRKAAAGAFAAICGAVFLALVGAYYMLEALFGV